MSDALLVVSIVGTVAFALSGVMAAAEAEMDWLSAVVLGAFVVVGTSVALDAGASYFVAAVMGVITGVGGGVLRDVLARRTPIVLVGEIYAVAGLLGAAVQLALREFGAGANLEIWLSLAIIVAVRAIAVRRSLNLPRLTRN